MIVEDQPAWPHLRSRSVLCRSARRHFVDPSLAVAALRATPDRLLGDLNLLALLFESLVVRDLRVYAQASDAQVLQYRDNTGLEVDAIGPGRRRRGGPLGHHVHGDPVVGPVGDLVSWSPGRPARRATWRRPTNA
jgi:hypothetical protein